MSIRSYVRSTDNHCESRSEYVFPSIDVSIDAYRLTARTIPTANIQRQLIHYKTAMVASFRTRKESVNRYQCSPVPITFIFKLTEKLTPSCIANTTSQLVVFNHVSNCEVFNNDRAIFFNQASSQLVQEIGTSIFDFGVYSSYFKSRFTEVIRA